MCSSDIFLGLIAILFPPIAVWVKTGICSADSLINLCLCMLGFVPGLLHAWYIIAKHPEYDYDSLPQDTESGRVTYVIVTSPNGRKTRVPASHVRPANAPYGTTAPMAPPVHQDQNGTWSNDGAATAGSSNGAGAVPPSYAEAVKGDHKVQSAH
ncbi:Plasma membrane proteolipid [Lachnellula suecica]|uniref:Plasma membrane proteolipid n=1 Tax=Lachnellula suecica TaxID=602035 RepID=A0A8T9C845_9HELO|nr:Plasma membrane proteolipid [Lachnellula suecica]